MKKENKAFSYIKAKGFYIALAVCIVGASAAAWSLANRTLDQIDDHNGQIVGESVSGEEKQWGSSQPQSSSGAAPTQEQQKDVSKPSPSASSSSQPESSAGSVTKPIESSKADAQQPAQQTVSYRWPMAAGEVINPFSGENLVKNKTLNVWRVHDAVDIKGEKGAAVLAVGDGKVAAISADALWGGMIQLEHADGTVTVYSGVTADKSLKTGQQVKAGDAIGVLDQIPVEIAMEPHIHLTMSKNGKAVDPETLLAK